MNAVGMHSFAVVAIIVLTSPSVTGVRAQQNTQPRDILGGASLIFGRPQNPPAHRRKPQQQNSQAGVEAGKPSAPATSDEPGDALEDALSLGNTARDRTPPDLVSAEKAYRLAWKLNPEDPRPYIGLGNVYFDQQRFPEAAKAYKDAINLQVPPKTRSFAGLIGGMSARTTVGRVAVQHGDWHAYLATAMLGQENLTGAETELRQAVAMDRNNARWRAQLGYALFIQKRYTEASGLYESALRLDENNQTYKEYLERAQELAREASAGDPPIAQRLSGTSWEIRVANAQNIRGICQLSDGGRLDCTDDKKQTLYGGLRWQIRDGLFALERVSNPRPAIVPGLAEPSCVGELRTDGIHLRCVAGDVVADEIWTRQNKH